MLPTERLSSSAASRGLRCSLNAVRTLGSIKISNAVIHVTRSTHILHTELLVGCASKQRTTLGTATCGGGVHY